MTTTIVYFLSFSRTRSATSSTNLQTSKTRRRTLHERVHIRGERGLALEVSHQQVLSSDSRRNNSVHITHKGGEAAGPKAERRLSCSQATCP